MQPIGKRRCHSNPGESRRIAITLVMPEAITLVMPEAITLVMPEAITLVMDLAITLVIIRR
ncbi:MAG: hypothetical protein ACI9W1_003454 [Candidatus Azotimanducaceae bacterium]|jgi:hypothetical protein